VLRALPSMEFWFQWRKEEQRGTEEEGVAGGRFLDVAFVMPVDPAVNREMVVPAHLRESVGTNGEKAVLQCFFFGLMSLSNLGPTCYFRKETDSNRGHRVRLQGNRALCSLTLFVIVFPVVTLQRISVKIYLSRVFLFPY
jgi:hypothetical protein